MLRIGIDSDEFAVFDGCNHAAARGAHRAVGWNFLDSDLENAPKQLIFFSTGVWQLLYNSTRSFCHFEERSDENLSRRSLTRVRDDNIIPEHDRCPAVSHRN